MEKEQIILNFSKLSEKDKLLMAKIKEMVIFAQDRKFFSGFLDERQRQLAKSVINQMKFDKYLFYGGYIDSISGDNGVRKVLGCFPENYTLSYDLFDIKCVKIEYRDMDKLTHRDFLGVFMSLNLKRETIGDIVVSEGQCFVFCSNIAAQVIISEVVKIGNVGITCSICETNTVAVKDNFEELNGTVSTLRLDAVVAFLTRFSREKSQNTIRLGNIVHNYEVNHNNSAEVHLNDKISIRGFGKFILSEVGAITKKGRVHIVCKKYL